jgi:hypothetical protein
MKLSGIGFIGAAIMLCILLAGCSGLSANSAMTTQIQAVASTAGANVATTQPASGLAVNAAGFAAIYANTTANIFASKGVHADATFYVGIMANSAIADAILADAQAGKLTADQMQTDLTLEARLAGNMVYQLNAVAIPAASAKSLPKAKVKVILPPLKASTGADINSIIASLPSALRPWATEYLPVLLRLGASETDAMIALLISGDENTPYRVALSAMTVTERQAELSNRVVVDVANTNVNAQNVQAERAAATALASLGLSLVLGLIGL